ncbi:uncharacterized protein [Phaseolus vulgaris]|uniref:uncharacterized protein n=1 Tax=Phaseolus vulgaris TaxID=3885 RepID=UPI0035CA3173
MAQMMEIMRALQENVEASRVQQAKMHEDLVASQARNEELSKVTEELRQALHEHRGRATDEEITPSSPPRVFPMPFAQAITDTTIPASVVAVKASFTGVEDPEAHLTAFHTQMMLFQQFSKLFVDQYIVKKAPPRVSYDLFDVRQYQGESLRDYLNRFGAQMVRSPAKDEEMLVYAFKKGVLPGPFSEALIRGHPATFAEVRRIVVAHIADESEVSEKRGNMAPARPQAQTRIQPQRVLETAAAKKDQRTCHPYDPKKNKGRGPGRPREFNRPSRYKFVMGLADLIAIPNIAARLKAPEKVLDKVLGPKPNAWCEFHQSFGHSLDSCLALGYQLDDLVKSGFLNDYLLDKRTGQASSSQPASSEGQQHEMPTHGEIHTIAGDVDITFTKEDLRDVVPHDNDPIVVSLVTAGRKVHRVLVDQGSSADVMFWPTFTKLQLPLDQLRPYGGCLYGFAGDQVEVRGYIELRTTFTDEAASRMEKIKYLVVNAPSAYNILLGRPTLNRIGVVPSTRHMKVKLPSMEGVGITIRSYQKEAKKCYENNLKTKR